MIVPSKILRDYFVCVGIVGIACALIPLGHDLPFSLATMTLRLAILGVGVTTFRWAGIRGIPARDREGHFQIENIVRSLAMTGVMTFAVFMASSPFFALAVVLARK
jgi:hypothetical protein